MPLRESLNKKEQSVRAFCRSDGLFSVLCYLGLLAAAALALKGEAVCAFGNCGVGLMCADSDSVQSAVMLCIHVVLAACYVAVNSGIFHFVSFPFGFIVSDLSDRNYYIRRGKNNSCFFRE